MITPLPAGSVFAGYHVEAVLAQGGMGVVYLATEEHPRRRVALKLIAPALAADPAYRERFLREVDALAALEHPNVVPIHAAGECDGQLYLAMRYLDGADLAELVRMRGPLPPTEALDLLAPVADALDVAHARGIVHRDVTPSNIRLDARGTPYLTDFGLTKRAAIASQTALTLGPMGTPAYMAPEQFTADGAGPASDPSLASRADVYALGCVLVLLLTGAPPYPRDTYEAALWAHVHADPPSLGERQPGLPAAIDAVVARALAKDPAARFATPGALLVAARAALVPGTGPAVSVSPSSITQRAVAAAARPAQGVLSGPSRSVAPPRRRPGRSTVARAAAILVLVAVAGTGIGTGLLVAGLGGAGPARSPGPSDAANAPTARPTDRPTPLPTPRPTPAPTPVPTPTLGTPEDVARLVSWVPRSLRKDCTSASLLSHDEIAALTCTARDVTLVRYGLFSSADRMSAGWSLFVEQAQIAPGGTCRNGEEAAGEWWDGGFSSIFGETRGSLACTVEQDSDARIDWTTVDALIWATLWQNDGEVADAYATWSSGKLNPLREPR